MVQNLFLLITVLQREYSDFLGMVGGFQSTWHDPLKRHVQYDTRWRESPVMTLDGLLSLRAQFLHERNYVREGADYKP